MSVSLVLSYIASFNSKNVLCLLVIFKQTDRSMITCIHSFIHSFIRAISIAPLQVLYYSEALPTTARILYRSFTPMRKGNCISKGLAHGSYVRARAGVEPTTPRLKVIVSTKALPRSTIPTTNSNNDNTINKSSQAKFCLLHERL